MIAITYSGLDESTDDNDPTDIILPLPDPLNMSQLIAYFLRLKLPLKIEAEMT